ncbi:MAG TPA: NAD(P)-dependent oxidoreductase [Myxococcota bacterium]|nr:NAD(P)-dependent oxidoreductase [Myxococcota bacterium]
MAIRVGFIGLGNQGKPIAAHLAPSGFETTVYDIALEPVQELVAGGARAASCPREVGERSDVIGICVPADEHVRAVVYGDDGLLAGAKPGAVIAIHSSVLPTTAIEIAGAAKAHGVAVLDACVTGGAERAKQKQITYIVGGDAQALEKVRPVFACNSVKIIHAGALGDGARLKFCINLITYLQWAAAFESFQLAKAIGLPTQVLEEAGQANGQLTPLMVNYLGGVKLPEPVRKSEPVQALMRNHMAIAEKDLAHVLTLAREAHLSLPFAALVSQSMARLYGVEDPNRR